jgi:uncharacterized iron-regulated protein
MVQTSRDETSYFRRGWRCGSLLLALVSMLVVSGVQAHAGHDPAAAADQAGARPLTTARTAVLDLGTLSDIEGLVARLGDRRVVLVGEIHDRYEHHLNQLAIIRGLHARDPNLVIGLEFFQQPYQESLDRYVAGEIDERELLRQTEYFQRWRFDYRLYRPILEFARQQGIPLLALNIPGEITNKVRRLGMEGLSDEERAWIPESLDRSNPAYEARIRKVYDQHPPMAEGSFETFLEAQLLWDEGMAERAARYLEEHPEKRMVILAGSGHLEYGDGIPDRLERRAPVETAIVINGLRPNIGPDLADYLLLPERVELPRPALLGVLLEADDEGVDIKGFSEDSPARQAGLRKGDRILRVAGEPVSSYADIRLALLDRPPGDQVQVDVRRKRWFLGAKELSFEVDLQ